MRGQTIAQTESNVRRLDANEYRVKSQSGSGEYVVLSTPNRGGIAPAPTSFSESRSASTSSASNSRLRFGGE